MQTGFLSDVSVLPLVVGPQAGAATTSREALVEWARANGPWIDDHLLAHGALLFRGFRVRTPEAFESIATAISPQFSDYVGGISPRRHVVGAVSTSTEAPSFVPIPLHCEMAYLDRYPSKVMFWCQVPPVRGGQTPLADMAAVYRALDPDVRSRLEQRGLLLVETVPGRRRLLTPRTWRERFGMDRAGIEAFCVERGIEAQWLEDGSLRLRSRRPAVILHPRSGEKIWFNAATMHDSYSWELRRVGRMLGASILAFSERRSDRRAAGLRRSHSTYGDGTEIARRDIEHIRRTLWDHAGLFDWQQGDVLVLDNCRVAHGRMPFKGPRRILVALGEQVRAEAYIPPVTRVSAGPDGQASAASKSR